MKSDAKLKTRAYGYIPESWEIKRIEEYTDVVTDYVANGSFASLAENVQYKETPDEAVLIRLVDYNNGFKGNFVFINAHAYEFLSKSKLFGGEIIISNVGANVGTVFKCPNLLYKMSLAPNAIMLRTKGIDDFFYYWFKGPIGQFALQSIVTGSAQPKFNKTTFRKLEIPVPPMEVQQKISNVLSTLDKKIAINQKINENLEQQAFALFENLLADAPDEECVISDIAILNPRRSIAKNQLAKCIDMAHLPTSGAFPTGWETKPFNGGMKFSNGDTLLARITPCLENGKTAFIDFLEDGEVAFGSTEYIVLSPKEGTPPEFLYCLARYPAFVDYAVKNMNGSSGRQRVSADTVGQYCLPKLSCEDFEGFGNTVAPLFLKMRYNSLENMRLSALRDTLIPKLMSGEIDLSNIQL